MALIQQAPPELIEEINRAYEEIQNIHKIAVEAKDKIAKEEEFDRLVQHQKLQAQTRLDRDDMTTQTRVRRSFF